MIMKCNNENNGTSIPIKDLLHTYKIITRIMKENGFMRDTSFRRVQMWLSNVVCDNLNDQEINET